jgi:hypothetical protein
MRTVFCHEFARCTIKVADRLLQLAQEVHSVGTLATKAADVVPSDATAQNIVCADSLRMLVVPALVGFNPRICALAGRARQLSRTAANGRSARSQIHFDILLAVSTPGTGTTIASPVVRLAGVEV